MISFDAQNNSNAKVEENIRHGKVKISFLKVNMNLGFLNPSLGPFPLYYSFTMDWKTFTLPEPIRI